MTSQGHLSLESNLDGLTQIKSHREKEKHRCSITKNKNTKTTTTLEKGTASRRKLT